jgi:hypothetical protein
MPVRKAFSLAPNKLCRLCNSAIDAYMACEQTTALSSEVAGSNLPHGQHLASLGKQHLTIASEDKHSGAVSQILLRRVCQSIDLSLICLLWNMLHG